MLECDEDGLVISYEEYHPYGTSAYRSGRSGVEVSERRFRYTGKERDEETGLYYHGARYYASWLGRWTSVDPVFRVEHSVGYEYVFNNPIIFIDPNGKDPYGEDLAEALAFQDDPQLYQAVDQAKGRGVLMAIVFEVTPAQVWLGLALALTTRIKSSNDVEGHLDAAMAALPARIGPSKASSEMSAANSRSTRTPSRPNLSKRSVQPATTSGKATPSTSQAPVDRATPVVAPTRPSAPVESPTSFEAPKAAGSAQTASKAVDPQLDASVASALLNPKDSGHLAAVAYANANKAAGLSINRHTFIKLLNTFTKHQINKLKAQYGIKLIRDVQLPELGATASRLERAFKGTGRVISAEDARVAATAILKQEKLATADIQFFKRAKDLGIDVEYIGSAENTATAAAYVPKPVVIPPK